MMRRISILVACALASSCGTETTERTQVMVVIDAQPGVRALTADVDLEVRSGTGPIEDWDVRSRLSVTPGDDIDWPLEAALVPQDNDADRVYLVIATARDEDGDAVSEVRAISGYVGGKTLSLLLLFEDSCLGRSEQCDDEQTCRGGDCVDANVEPGDLPVYERDGDGAPVLLPFWDAGTLDGGEDAGGGSGGSGGSGGMGGSGGTGGDSGMPEDCERDSDCDDADPCNGQETCDGGSCAAGTPFACEDTGEFCLQNVCVNDDGDPRCEEQNVHEGETCADNEVSTDAESACSMDYQCVEGECVPQTSESCDAGQCERRAGCNQDGCVLEPRSATTGCDDGNACTDTDLCSGTDDTCAGTPKDCSDSQDCTVDSCDDAGECVHTPDNSLCSGPCKSGTCDATMGCLNVTFEQDFIDCSDGSASTGPDLCYRGECLGGREGAPDASCEVGGCACSGFTNVRDLEYVTDQYVGLIEANQASGGSCAGSTVSIVYDVKLEELTPFTTDTANGALTETGVDINGVYVATANTLGLLSTSTDSVQWNGTPIEAALAAQVPSLINYRGIARHVTGSVATRTNHVWVWGGQMGTTAALVARCSWCSSVVSPGCDTITCTSAGFSGTTVASVSPYVNGGSFSSPYGGGIQLMNYATTPRRRIYEDGTGKDLVYNTIEVDDNDGTWNGTLRLSGAGQVLAFGSGTVNARICNDATYSGDTSCSAVTISNNPRSFTRAANGANGTVFLLGNNGTGQYLFVLPSGSDPGSASNWRELTLANSGSTTATAVAATNDSFMVLGKTGAVPYVWYWGP